MRTVLTISHVRVARKIVPRFQLVASLKLGFTAVIGSTHTNALLAYRNPKNDIIALSNCKKRLALRSNDVSKLVNNPSCRVS